MRLSYIAGLSHSGSTLLDLLLSGHPRVTGLGEVHPMVEPGLRERQLEVAGWARCSCGETLGHCPLWGPHMDRLRSRPEASGVDHLRALLHQLQESDQDRFFTDSSKHLDPLLRLLDPGTELPGIESLLAIHLLRDARGYAMSAKRRFRGRSLGGVRPLLHWYRANRVIERTLWRHDVPTLVVGYEELCFRTDATLERLCRFLDLPPHPPMASLGGPRGHVGTGNPMRLDENRSSRILYDHRWLLDPTLQATYLLLPFVRRYNERTVYGGGSEPRGAAPDEAP